MTTRPPRLAGPAVVLEPAPATVARAVRAGDDPAGALSAVGLTAGRGWPHAETPDALRGGAAGYLVVLDGAVVGECGFLGPVGADGSWEISYGLAAPARGRGTATEAVGLLAAWAEQQDGVTRLTADVLVGNEPSRRLLRRLAFTECGGAPPYVHYARESAPAVAAALAPAVARPRRITGRHVC